MGQYQIVQLKHTLVANNENQKLCTYSLLTQKKMKNRTQTKETKTCVWGGEPCWPSPKDKDRATAPVTAVGFVGKGGLVRCFKRLVWLQYADEIGEVTGLWVSNWRTIASFSGFRSRFRPRPAPSLLPPPFPPAVCLVTLAASLSAPSLSCHPPRSPIK